MEVLGRDKRTFPVNHPELTVVLRGMELAEQKRWQRIGVEIDSQKVACSIAGEQPADFWMLDPVVQISDIFLPFFPV